MRNQVAGVFAGKKGINGSIAREREAMADGLERLQNHLEWTP